MKINILLLLIDIIKVNNLFLYCFLFALINEQLNRFIIRNIK